MYYRIYFNKDNGNVVFPVMDEDDERDYSESSFLDQIHYSTEKEAIEGFLLMRAKAEIIIKLKMEYEV